MKRFFRVLAVSYLCVTTAYAGESSPSIQLPDKTLAVSVTAADENKVAEVLNLPDLEHFLVSELKRKRFAAIALTSIQGSLEDDESVYVVEVGIDQAEIAQRPVWNWMDKRFLDDEILHLELSLSVTRLKDGESLGSLYHSYDYRAEDYGRFSSPQAIRGAVYEAVAAMSSNFATAIERGDFGGDLESFQHSFAPQDALDLFSQLPTGLEVLLLLVTFLGFVLILGLAYRLLCGILGLFVPRRPAPQVMVVRERPRRKVTPALEGYATPGREPEEEEDLNEGDESEEEEIDEVDRSA